MCDLICVMGCSWLFLSAKAAFILRTVISSAGCGRDLSMVQHHQCRHQYHVAGGCKVMIFIFVASIL